MADVEAGREDWAQEVPPAPPKEIQVRTARWNNDSGIDCEFLHEVYGWIPFTARVDDVEEFGRQLYADLLYGKYGTVAQALELNDLQKRALWKLERERLVAAIVVTTVSGKAFDGDEISQWRMARAILALQTKPEGETTEWVLSDNTVVQVNASELTEALALAGAAQTAIWVQE